MTLWINLRATLRGEKLVTYWPQAKPRFRFFRFGADGTSTGVGC